MRRIFFIIIFTVLTFNFINFRVLSEENVSETELNIFTGLFDFSDDKQKSGLVGIQHQNKDLFRNSFLGKLSPITGGFLTENNAYYLYLN